MGKTEEAIKLANKTGAYLLVANRMEANRIAHRCDRHPVTLDEILDRQMRGSFVKNMVVDNADWILQTFLFHQGIHKVEAITINDPDFVHPEMKGKNK